MSRPYCSSCQRPQVSCICHLTFSTKNNVHVVVLQHPSEEHQTKGTVKLLEQSLSSCQVFIGEDFSQHQGLIEVLNQYKRNTVLLYPSDKATVLQGELNENMTKINQKIECIILLDGTWKKAYRLYMMNSALHKIPHCVLPDSLKGEYQIRKTKKHGALSTLEACCYGLGMIEKQPENYLGLLEQFKKFNVMQLAFLPNTPRQ
ncbi:tRNA-uridine aminocarboxypropyltransferase [Colwelliaceae bacterium 6441]